MSRNLGDTSCRICHHAVVMCGGPHLITKEEARVYFDEYNGMTVAEAVCTYCDAKYLAWCVAPPSKRWGHFANSSDAPFFDLSFRRSFDDEPAPEDLPTTVMLQRVQLEQCAADLERAADEAALAVEELREKAAEATAALARNLAGPPRWEVYRR